MGAYLDRLNAQHDEILAGITAVIDRAAEDNRDVTDAEQQQVDRDRSRLSELQTAITHYSDLEKQAATVGELRRTMPAPVTTRTAGPTEPEYSLEREFPSAGDYAITLHRAYALKDPAAVAKIDRATQHQTLADNPGIVPRQVLGPVVNLIDGSRPFINSISRKPLPSGSFDRPQITQHVAVGKQSAEKQLTDSQKMIIGKLPVTAATYAGHLNISRQDVKWTSPGIMQIVFEDFAVMYAQATCDDASTQFVASVTNAPITVGDGVAGIMAAFYEAAAASMAAAGGAFPDTLWAAPDVWGALGGMVNGQDSPAFPSLSVTSTAGNPLGLRLVVDDHFDPGTAIIGPSRLAEWYEDVDGLMQVGEPDVLGQLVGYAGFGAFLNVAPAAFSKLTLPAPV